MKRRAALTAGLAASWAAASPMSAEAQDTEPSTPFFEIETETDADMLVWVGDQGASWMTDARIRVDAERVVSPSLRFGFRIAGGAVAGELSRGPGDAAQCGAQACPTSGLVTGLAGLVSGKPATDRAALTRAEFYVLAGLFEARAGLGASAASAERPAARQAFRLAIADGALSAGSGLANTSLSLGAPTLVAAVSTRRLAGVRASVSYAPESDPCGLDVCSASRALGAPEIDDIWSAAVSFDRRIRSTRVRWAASAGYEQGAAASAHAGAGVSFEDPWIASLRIVREEGPVSLSASWLATNDGLSGGRYEAASVTAAFETGDWMLSLSSATAASDTFDVDHWVAVLGASRLVGQNAILGVGVRIGDDRWIEGGGSALLVEAGWRF